LAEPFCYHVNPIGPRACYDEGKRCAEALTVSYARQYAVQTRIARIFNTYGPRMHPDDGRVVSNFVVQALRGAPITIYGDGSQSRSFCYVSDLVDALTRLMASAEEPGPINLGNPHEQTIRELAELIVRLAGSASELRYEDLPTDDPVRRRPDIRNARKVLSWSPKVSIEDGLRNTIDYFRRILSVPSSTSRGASSGKARRFIGAAFRCVRHILVAARGETTKPSSISWGPRQEESQTPKMSSTLAAVAARASQRSRHGPNREESQLGPLRVEQQRQVAHTAARSL
jgi:hypothetical protein